MTHSESERYAPVVWQRPALALLSGVLLALPFCVPSLFLLSWFAFVPLLIALEGQTPGRAYFLGLTAGAGLAMVAASWMVTFVTHLKGYSLPLSLALSFLAWLYMAHILALPAAALSWARRHTGLPLLWLTPLAVALAFLLFPLPLQIRLGESQSLFLAALQPISAVGVHGLDWMIGLVNSLTYTMLRPGKADSKGQLIALCLVAGWFSIGLGLLFWHEHANSEQPHRSFGLVQPNRPALLEPGPQAPGFTDTHPPAMAITRQLAAAGVDLVAWPETRFLHYFSNPAVAESYRRQIRQMGVPLLFQDMERVQGEEFNTAVLLGADGAEAGHYRKVHRVPFAEYLPTFAGSALWLERWLGGFVETVSAGKGPEQLDVNGLRLIPLICYEIMFPQYVAEAAGDGAETRTGTEASVLLALSNNSWFGSSSQPRQHLNASALRAVENRLPLVHVMNNGPSAVFGPTGRILFLGTPQQRTGYKVDVPVLPAGGATLYQRYPMAAPALLYTSGGLVLLLAMVRWFRHREGAARPAG